MLDVMVRASLLPIQSRARPADDLMSSIKLAFVEPNLRFKRAPRKDANASAANPGTVIISFPDLDANPFLTSASARL